MNTHQAPGHRSGEGSARLWELINEDDRRKRPSAAEALRKPIGDVDHQWLHGDMFRRRTPPGE